MKFEMETRRIEDQKKIGCSACQFYDIGHYFLYDRYACV